MKKSKFPRGGCCELRYDMHWHDVRPCFGAIKKVGVVRLCLRHRMLVRTIRRAALNCDIRPVKRYGHVRYVATTA